MMNHVLVNLFLVLILGFGTQAGAQWEQPSVGALKKKARAFLLKRKRGFDQYLKNKKQAEIERLKDAHKMKQVRKAYAEKREKLRSGFVRRTEAFPHKDYVKFLEQRKRRHQQLEQKRRDYVAVQNELKEIYENKKYKIDGNKEFDL